MNIHDIERQKRICKIEEQLVLQDGIDEIIQLLGEQGKKIEKVQTGTIVILMFIMWIVLMALIVYS